MFWRIGMTLATRRITITNWFVLLILIVTLAACSKANKPSFRVFASAEDASTALMEAAK